MIKSLCATYNYYSSLFADNYAIQANNNRFLTVNRTTGEVKLEPRVTNDAVFHNLGYGTRMNIPMGANEHLFPCAYTSIALSDGNMIYYDYANETLAYDVNNNYMTSNASQTILIFLTYLVL